MHARGRRGRGGWIGPALLVVLVWAASGGWAQDLRYLRHQAWSTEDGLPQDSVHAIAQTADGFLWVATERGVARFDGTSFQILSSASDAAFVSNDACCLVVARDGDLWIGTADGAIRRRGGTLTRFGVGEGLPGAANGESAIKGLVAMADGAVLLLTAEGLATTRESGGFRPVAASFAVRGIAAATGGGAWLVGDRQVALLRDGVVTAADVGGAGLVGIRPGLEGAVWSATRDTVTWARDGAGRRWKVGAGLAGSRVETLFVDRRGAAWVGTNDGLSVIDAEGSAPRAVTVLRGNTVLTVFEDREGNTWVGTETSGLHVLRPLAFRSEAALADRSITSVTQASDGAVWVGTWNDGLRRLKRDGAADVVRVDALTSPVVLALAAGADGSVWAGTPDGLNHVDAGGRVRQVTAADGLPDEYVESLAGSPDGAVWVGTRHGLVRLRGKAMQVLTRAEGLGGDSIGALLLTRAGELWVATVGGLSRRAADGTVTTFARGGGGIVTALTEDGRGGVWVGTETGEVGRVEGDGVRPAYRVAGAARVMGLETDARGGMWVRTAGGFARVAMADLDRCAAMGLPCAVDVRRYELADGIPSLEVAAAGAPMLWRMTDGEVWGATRRGVAIVNPEHLLQKVQAPGVVVERMLFGDRAVALGGAPIRLPYGGERLTVEYAGLSYTVPSKVRYRVRLEGFDTAWVDVGVRRSATYTNLPARAYRFRVQATTDGEVWSEAGGEVAFRIVPPIYRRWWFLVVAGFVLLGFFLSLYLVRVRSVRARFEDVLKERNRIAREIHDTLAQDFVGVSLQLDLMAQYLQSSRLELVAQQIQQTRKLVTDGLKEARQSIWALRSNLTSESLPNELREVVAQYGTESMVVALTVTGAFRPLGARVEGEVLRVAKEALSNMARHAEATAAEVVLRYGRDMLVLGVHDDGRGFVMDTAMEREGHYGLRGLRERAEVVGGALHVVTAPGSGTRITLEVPIGFQEE